MPHRTPPPLGVPEVYPFDAPFSAFDFVEETFGGCPSIRRAFSLARASGECQAVVVEKIAATGLIQDENDELASMSFIGGDDCLRVSFWKVGFSSHKDVEAAESSALIGYFIAKCDGKTLDSKSWHVFEAVFRKYNHPHNCVARAASYSVRIADKVFDLPGVLYCQQNGLNKACAHVALRALLSRIVPEGDVSYSKINAIARNAVEDPAGYNPGDGLSTRQIESVLDAFNVSYCDMDYEAAESDGVRDIRKIHPYQNDLYAGVESGMGALLGFKLGDPVNPVSKHIIPFYGHTFNKDTWVTDAENSYFKIGSSVGYIPSDNWTSSFIGHDDNFGSNFCVPRLYVKPEQVDYVAALYPSGVRLTGSALGGLALLILSEIYAHIPVGNKWLSRLKEAFSGPVPQVVFRTVCLESAKYFSTLAKDSDWNGRHEDPRILQAFSTVSFPKYFQVVEISLPQLFAANERKIGDIVFDAGSVMPDRYSTINELPFIFARLPQIYFLMSGKDREINCFSTMPSSIVSHVPVLSDY